MKCFASRGGVAILEFALAILPWLNPFAVGPSAAAAPLLSAWVCLGLLVLLATHSQRIHIDGWTWSRLAAWSWLVAALASVGIGLVQYLGYSNALAPWVNVTSAGIAYANLRQTNQFATLCSIGLLALMWVGGRRRLTGCAAAALGCGLALSASRTGALQLILIAVLAWWWRADRDRERVWMVAIALAAYALTTLLLPLVIGLGVGGRGLLARLQGAEATCLSRLTLWGNVVHLIQLRPWGGWGWGELDYAHFITLYPQTRFCDILDNAHNLPLHLAVELGLPVSALVCGAVAWAVWRGKPWAESDAARQLAWGVLAVIGLHSLLEYPLWYGPFQIAVLMCLAILYKKKNIFPVATKRHKAIKIRAILTGCAGLLVVGSSYALFDYWRVSQIYRPLEARAAPYRDDTLRKVQVASVFQNHAQFAELTMQPVTPDNAERMRALASELLHFSPEERVAGKLIEANDMLGRADEAQFYRRRYEVAFKPGAR
jgi:O-antigen ligase